MSARPKVICHMMSSLDGGLHPSRYTESAVGAKKEWDAAYEAVHETLGGDAWLVGRVTMAEMAKGVPHPSPDHAAAERPIHIAARGAGRYAVAVDTSGKLHFRKPDINGDAVIVLLGGGVSDQHLAELAGDGISYVVSDDPEIDLADALATLRREFGIECLLLEGGGATNGAFFAAGLVDELSLLVAPAIVGRVGEQVFVSNGDEGLKGKVKLFLVSVKQIDHELLQLRYAVATP